MADNVDRQKRYNKSAGPSLIGIRDLRELLNIRRQEKNLREEGSTNTHRSSNEPPPDPPSLLKDSLRGDEVLQQKYDSKFSRGTRSRGRWYRRSGPGFRRGGSQPSRGTSSSDNWERGKTSRSNIKVEVTVETGHRKCTIDNDSNIINNAYENNQRKFHGRRNFRGPRRGRGSYRGRNFYHTQNDQTYLEHHTRQTSDRRKFDIDRSKNNLPEVVSKNLTKQLDVCEQEEENWDNDDIKTQNTNADIRREHEEYSTKHDDENSPKTDNVEENITTNYGDQEQHVENDEAYEYYDDEEYENEEQFEGELYENVEEEENNETQNENDSSNVGHKEKQIHAKEDKIMEVTKKSENCENQSQLKLSENTKETKCENEEQFKRGLYENIEEEENKETQNANDNSKTKSNNVGHKEKQMHAEVDKVVEVTKKSENCENQSPPKLLENTKEAKCENEEQFKGGLYENIEEEENKETQNANDSSKTKSNNVGHKEKQMHAEVDKIVEVTKKSENCENQSQPKLLENTKEAKHENEEQFKGELSEFIEEEEKETQSNSEIDSSKIKNNVAKVVKMTKKIETCENQTQSKLLENTNETENTKSDKEICDIEKQLDSNEQLDKHKT